MAATRARLRVAPSDKAAILAVVAPGVLVRVLDRRDGWMRVECAGRRPSGASASGGWIDGTLLRPAPGSSAASGPAEGAGR